MWLLLTLILISAIGAVCKYLPVIIPPLPSRDDSCYLGNHPKAFVNSPKDLNRKYSEIHELFYPGNPILHEPIYGLRNFPKWGWIPDRKTPEGMELTDWDVMNQNAIDGEEVEHRNLLYNQWIYTGDFREDWHLPVVQLRGWKTGYELNLLDTTQYGGVVTVESKPEPANIKENPSLGTVGWRYVSIDEAKKGAAEERKRVLEETLPILWQKFPFYDKYWEIIQEYIWHIEPWRPSDEKITSERLLAVRSREKKKIDGNKYGGKNIYFVKPACRFAFYSTYFVPPLTYEQKKEVLKLCKDPEIKEKSNKYFAEVERRNKRDVVAINELKRSIKQFNSAVAENIPDPLNPFSDEYWDKPGWMYGIVLCLISVVVKDHSEVSETSFLAKMGLQGSWDPENELKRCMDFMDNANPRDDLETKRLLDRIDAIVLKSGRFKTAYFDNCYVSAYKNAMHYFDPPAPQNPDEPEYLV